MRESALYPLMTGCGHLRGPLFLQRPTNGDQVTAVPAGTRLASVHLSHLRDVSGTSRCCWAQCGVIWLCDRHVQQSVMRCSGWFYTVKITLRGRYGMCSRVLIGDLHEHSGRSYITSPRALSD